MAPLGSPRNDARSPTAAAASPTKASSPLSSRPEACLSCPLQEHKFDWFVLPLVRGTPVSFVEWNTNGGWHCLLCDDHQNLPGYGVEEHSHTWSHLNCLREIEARREEIEAFIAAKEKEHLQGKLLEEEQEKARRAAAEQKAAELAAESESARIARLHREAPTPKPTRPTAEYDLRAADRAYTKQRKSGRVEAIRDQMVDSRPFEAGDKARRLRAQRLASLRNDDEMDVEMRQKMEEKERLRELRRERARRTTQEHLARLRREKEHQLASCFGNDFLPSLPAPAVTACVDVQENLPVCGWGSTPTTDEDVFDGIDDASDDSPAPADPLDASFTVEKEPVPMNPGDSFHHFGGRNFFTACGLGSAAAVAEQEAEPEPQGYNRYCGSNFKLDLFTHGW